MATQTVTEDEHKKIADVMVKSVETNENVAVSTLWQDKTCVIVFLRRFGCMLCRVGAKEMSDTVKTTLDAHDIRFIGIGVEEFGLQDFLDGKYFAGELFIDTEKECYRRLNYKRYNMLSILPALFTGRSAISKARQTGIDGNLKGDGMQNGGVLIVSAGGEKTIYSWSQPSPTDHADSKQILAALGLET